MGWFAARPESFRAHRSERTSGGTWKFDSEVLFVTWQTKSQNIYFEGEKSKDVTKRITSLLKAIMLQ